MALRLGFPRAAMSGRRDAVRMSSYAPPREPYTWRGRGNAVIKAAARRFVRVPPIQAPPLRTGPSPRHRDESTGPPLCRFSFGCDVHQGRGSDRTSNAGFQVRGRLPVRRLRPRKGVTAADLSAEPNQSTAAGMIEGGSCPRNHPPGPGSSRRWGQMGHGRACAPPARGHRWATASVRREPIARQRACVGVGGLRARYGRQPTSLLCDGLSSAGPQGRATWHESET